MFHVSFRTLFQNLWKSAPRSRASRSCSRSKRYRPRLRMLEARFTPSVDMWTGANHAVDNNWSDGLNWSLLAPPGVNDTAVFTNNSNVLSFTSNVDGAFANPIAALTIDGIWSGTVNVNSALSVTGSLELGSGTLNTGGGLTIGGSASDWMGGQINLGANNFTNNGILQVDTSVRSLVLNGTGTLLNNGAIQEGGTNTLSLENGAVLTNAVGAVFNFADDANVAQSGGGTLSNYGTIEKTGGTGTSSISSSLASTGGVIDSESGVLNLDSNGATISGGTNGAALEAGVGGSSSAALDLTGGQAVGYSGSFTGSGSGTIYLDSGKLVVPSTGVSFHMPAGMFQWSSGIIDVGSGGTFTNAAGSFLNANTSTASLVIAGNNNNPDGTLLNQGTVLLSGGNDLIMNNTAIFSNAAGGTLNITSDAGITSNNGGGTLDDAGLLEKTGGTGSTVISCAYSQTASSLVVQSGTLVLGSNGAQIQGCTLAVAAGAALNLTGGEAVTYSGSFTGSGAGSIYLNSGTLVVPHSGLTWNMPAGMFQWSNGVIDVGTGGTFTNAAGSVLNADASSVNLNLTGNNNNPDGGLLNQGTVLLSGGNNLILGYSAVFTNGASGTFDITSDAGITLANNGTLDNAGLLEKTGGAGSTVISCAYNQTAPSLVVQTGTLVLASSGAAIQGCTLAVAAGAALDLTGGEAVTYSGSFTGSGAGSIYLNSGTLVVPHSGLTWNMPAGMFQWSNGVIDVGTGGTFTNAKGSTLSANTTIANLNLTGNNNNPDGTLLNQGTVLLSGGNNLIMNNTAIFSNAAGGTLNITSDASITSNNGGGTLDDAGLLEKTGGTGSTVISCAYNQTAPSLVVQTGTLVLASYGAQIQGCTLAVAAGAALDLTGGEAVTYSGSFTGSGAGSVVLSHGSLVVPRPGVTFNMPAGMFQWSNGVIDVGTGGTFTNAKGSTLSANTTIANLNLTGNNNNPNGGLLNQGTVLLSGGNNLIMNNTAIFSNAAGGTLNITSDASITSNNGGGSVINAGMLKKTGGTGFTTIACSFSNTGTLQVTTGYVTVSGTVTQVSAGTLTAGTWVVSSTPSTSANLAITSAAINGIGSHARVTVNGVHSNFFNLSNLATILTGGTLSLLGNQFLTVTGAFTNSGHLTLSAGSIFTTNGDFTETSTAALTLHIGKVGAANSMGNIVSNSGVVSLAGSLAVASTVVPALGSCFSLLDNEGTSGISGTFSGLTEGTIFTVKDGVTSMIFQITYVATDNDGNHNVVITRTA